MTHPALVAAIVQLARERIPQRWEELDRISQTLGREGLDKFSQMLAQHGALGWLRLTSSTRRWYAIGDTTGRARRANEIVDDFLQLFFLAVRSAEVKILVATGPGEKVEVLPGQFRARERSLWLREKHPFRLADDKVEIGGEPYDVVSVVFAREELAAEPSQAAPDAKALLRSDPEAAYRERLSVWHKLYGDDEWPSRTCDRKWAVQNDIKVELVDGWRPKYIPEDKRRGGRPAKK